MNSSSLRVAPTARRSKRSTRGYLSDAVGFAAAVAEVSAARRDRRLRPNPSDFALRQRSCGVSGD